MFTDCVIHKDFKTSASPTLFDCVSDFITVTIFEYQMSGLFYMNKIFKIIIRINNSTNFNKIFGPFYFPFSCNEDYAI